MKILALDTSQASQSVALLEDQEVLSEIQGQRPTSHTETLIPSIQKVLDSSGVGLAELDLLAVSSGPGSFTGLRIGLSTVKALGLSLKKPVVGVNTLLALAAPHFSEEISIVPALDARMGEIYGAVYRRHAPDAPIETRLKPQALKVSEFLAQLAQLEGPQRVVGTALGAYPELAQELKRQAIPDAPWVQAAWVGRLALEVYRQGGAITGQALQPAYLRPSLAEQRRLEMKGF